jgi:hypothetical protein
MTILGLTRFTTTTLAAAAIGLGALMALGAPHAHASEKSDCQGKGGSYSETTIVDHATGKTGTVSSCCVKDTATNTTSCTSTTVTKANRVPVDIPPGSIISAETAEPTQPIHHLRVIDVVRAKGFDNA